MSPSILHAAASVDSLSCVAACLHVSRSIIWVWTLFVCVLVLVVVAVNLAGHHGFLDTLLFAIALAVGLTPEFLPMITTVTLTQGAIQLSRQHVIVKHLAAIEVRQRRHHPNESSAPDERVQRAANLMRSLKVGCLPGLEEQHLVGIVTEADLLHIVEELPDAALARPVSPLREPVRTA